MKKLFMLLLMVCLLVFLAACGGGDSTTTDTGGQTDETADDASAGSGEVVVLKLSHCETPQDTLQVSGLDFEKYVEEKSNGSIDVQLYPNSELGNDVESVEGCLLGSIEMSFPSTAQITNYEMSYGVLDLPFLFKDLDTAYAAVDGELGERLKADAVNSGFHVLGFYLIGNRSMINNVRAIETPADMQGLDIRVMESPIYISMMESLGANPTPMSFSELYTALQQGAVDGAEGGPVGLYNNKFHEVQKYLSLTSHVISFGVITMGEDFFQSLTPEQQEILEEGAQLYLVDEQRELKQNGEADAVQKMIDEGITMNEITPENHALFVEAVQPVYDQFREEIGQDIFDLVDQYNNQ